MKKFDFNFPKITIPKIETQSLSDLGKVDPQINPALFDKLTTTSEMLDFLKKSQAANEKFQTNQVVTNKRFHK